MPRLPRCSLAALGAALVLVPPAPAADLLPEVGPTLLRIHELDAPYRVVVPTHERAEGEPGRLFGDLPPGTRLHESYQATFDFCQEFDPYDASDSEVSDARIRAYLESIQDMAPLREAFRVTRRGLADLQAIWFRRGRGFEHVICGESGGKIEGGRKLGGYHFWYMQYRYEQAGTATYAGSRYWKTPLEEGIADRGVVAGMFTWDPDGPGGAAPMPKVPLGGFTVGNSVAALLALGHLGYYGARRHPVEANLNGKVYPFTFWRKWKDGASSVRTLWPRWVGGPSTYGR